MQISRVIGYGPIRARTSNEGTDITRKRIFAYADKTSLALYAVGTLCAIAAGALLPVMDLGMPSYFPDSQVCLRAAVFGKFVNVFNDFAIGRLDPAGFRAGVSKFTYD